jgi:hypothetical protein
MVYQHPMNWETDCAAQISPFIRRENSFTKALKKNFVFSDHLTDRDLKPWLRPFLNLVLSGKIKVIILQEIEATSFLHLGVLKCPFS